MYAISKGGKIPLQVGNPAGHTTWLVTKFSAVIRRQRLFPKRERPRIPRAYN
jgi:hypothetical protein